MKEKLVWRCSICEKIHEGLPAITFDAPGHYQSIPTDERHRRAKLDKDTCIIDDKAFYVRSVLIVPIVDHDETLEWGVWSSLSQANFERYNSTFSNLDQGKLGPMFSWFGSGLPLYEDTTGLRCNVIPQNNNKRPFIEFDPEQNHQLVIDQIKGISLERAIEFATLVIHKH
ncbi:MAG: DUF2199 domain-containing protein [Chitinophagales bacterium]|nr:DUF2199 domain-containing protein [Hyphomicrobiales bacterium]